MIHLRCAWCSFPARGRVNGEPYCDLHLEGAARFAAQDLQADLTRRVREGWPGDQVLQVVVNVTVEPAAEEDLPEPPGFSEAVWQL